MGKLPLKLIAPLTAWKESFKSNPWQIRFDPNTSNGLTKLSAADVLQIRSADEKRFIRQLGRISPDDLKRLTKAIAVVIEYE